MNPYVAPPERGGIATGERVALALLVPVSALLAVITYNHLGEDAYITFRYADQLARGNGLVFHAGDPQEGYSNLLWVLVLALAKALGWAPEDASRWLSIALHGGAMLAAWGAARRLLGDRAPAWARLLPAVLIGVHPLLRYHIDRGLETVPYSAVLVVGLLAASSGGAVWLAALCAAAATLLRPEGVAFGAALALPLFVSGWKERRLAPAFTVAGAAVAAFAAQMVHRVAVFDQWLPNTVLAKSRGGSGAVMEVVRLAASTGGVPLLALAGWIRASRHEALRPLAAGCALQAAGAVAFQLQAGVLANEAWRYMAPIYAPCAVGLWLLVAPRAGSHRAESPARAIAAWALALWSVILWSERPEAGKARLFEGNRDALRSRFHVRLVEFARRPDLAFHWQWWNHGEIYINAEAGRWVRANLPANAHIAADQLGQFGYFAAPTQRFLDLLGLMDDRVAMDIRANRKAPDFAARHHEFLVGEVLLRSPDYLVLYCFADDRFWPRDLRGKPVVGQLRALMEDPRVAAAYAPVAVITPRETISNVNFTVWSRRRDGMPPPAIERVGPDSAEFEKWWRVL